jgi:tripartite-type tricarboxylate transporter receptor subunit TctC
MPRTMSRRRILAASLQLAALTGGGTRLVHAAARLPTTRFICGYPPGGSLDLVSRKLAERFQGRYANLTLVDNKPGASGRLAVEELRKSPADGSCLLITPASVLTMYPHIYKPLSYDPFADLAPVAMVAATEFAFAVGEMVPPSVKSLEDFVRWCKTNPAKAACGNAGAGSMPHFMALLFARDAGAELLHVPFKGGSAAMQAVAAGQIGAALATDAAALPMERSGKVRVIATSGAGKSAFFPQAVPFREQGYRALVQREWFGAFAPARTGSAELDAANEILRQAMGEADVQEQWKRLGLSVATSTAGELQAAMRSEHDFWGPLIRSSGFTPEA